MLPLPFIESYKSRPSFFWANREAKNDILNEKNNRVPVGWRARPINGNGAGSIHRESQIQITVLA